MTPPPEFSQPRRSFVKKFLATSVSISFAGLIRAHGEEGGGTTTVPETTVMLATAFETTGGTTYPETTVDPWATTCPETTVPETTCFETTCASTQPPQSATEYETVEVIASSHVYKTVSTVERKCHKIDDSTVSQWITQSSTPSFSPTIAIDGQAPGKWPPPPNQPPAPQGQGWQFAGWKENLIELQKAVEASTGTLLRAPEVYAEGSTNSTTGVGLPSGFTWSTQVRKIRTGYKNTYVATALFRRAKPSN